MSRETMEWLNTMTRIGYADKHGRAWHYDGSAQNHFDGPVPLASVMELLGWEPRVAQPQVSYTDITEDGVTTHVIVDQGRKAVIRPVGTLGPDDKGAVLYYPRPGYPIRGYSDWLVSKVGTLLDTNTDDLAIYSAGMLRKGAQAWVQIMLADTLMAANGIEVNPFLLAVSSLDGSRATSYSTGNNLAVCDNTVQLALSASAQSGTLVKFKKTSNSDANANQRILDARDALNIVLSTGDDIIALINALDAVKVTDRQWTQFLEVHAPTVDPVTKESKSGRGLTLAKNEQDALDNMYKFDNRVAPWQGTAFGVMQAVNTFTHHESSIRGMERAERNADRMVSGEWADLDRLTLAELDRVLDTELAELVTVSK